MKSAHPTIERRRRWRPLVNGVAMAALAATLVACKTSRETTASILPSEDYRQRHPIVIQERDRTIVVLVGKGRGGLTPAQRADVAAFAIQWKRETTGGVVIDLPVRTPNARAASDTLREIQSVLVAAGVPADGIRVDSYQPPDPDKLAPIKISYPRMTADAGPCGQWPHDLGPSYDPAYLENRQYYNLGCATQRNLAAAVDNPADLVQPRGETPASTGRRTFALEKYRKGESTATIDSSADKGKISDVGK
jgi:pilus assembly protein CpaD